MIMLKSLLHINEIKKSCKLLAKMFDEILPKVKAGMTTRQIDDMAVKFIEKHGGKPAWYKVGFDGAVCISINEEVIHGIPSKSRIIKDGDIVSIDAGIDLNGYISDCTKTIAIGEVPEKTKKLMEVTKECLAAGIEACKIGNRIFDISQAVYDIATKHGYGVVYEYSGHGVGFDIHEDPCVPNVPPRKGFNPRIQAGMVLAIEPMINMGTGDVDVLEDGWTVVSRDRSLSCHEEHTVAVFPDHTEILTIL
ncbi:MAG: type I methionyl aminopeptidase [Treponema sp.]|nr:type I methionyl aminopeptidase [Treponema sp.]